MGWPEGLPITDTLATGTLERLVRAASLYDFEWTMIRVYVWCSFLDLACAETNVTSCL